MVLGKLPPGKLPPWNFNNWYVVDVHIRISNLIITQLYIIILQITHGLNGAMFVSNCNENNLFCFIIQGHKNSFDWAEKIKKA